MPMQAGSARRIGASKASRISQGSRRNSRCKTPCRRAGGPAGAACASCRKRGRNSPITLRRPLYALRNALGRQAGASVLQYANRCGLWSG
jgi:hypothetical protein